MIYTILRPIPRPPKVWRNHQRALLHLLRRASPRAIHQDIVGNIFYLVRHYLETNRRGRIRIAPSEVRLTEKLVYEPDLYYVSRSRESILTERGTNGAPNLVIEVLSPRTAKLDKGAKRADYARADVEELWIVDPDAKRIHDYRFEQSAEEPVGSYGVGQKIESPLFPGLKIPVAKVFRQ